MISAHGVVLPGELGRAWSFDPTVVAGLAVAALLYLRGSRRVPSASRRIAFYCGLAVIAAALVSPLDALGETLFSAHMVQHMLLIGGAAPLIVFGAPLLPMTLALPRAFRRVRLPSRARRWILNPFAAGSLHAVVLWAWHLPAPYEAALRSEPAHALEHVSFLSTSLLLWAFVIPGRSRRRFDSATALALVFVTALQSGALGALLTFAGDALYPAHAPGARAWGLTPLEDQQLAGAIMWIPGGFLYLAAMAVLLVTALKGMDRALPRTGEQQ